MDTKCFALGIILLAVGFGLGFALNDVFNPGPAGGLRSQLLIREIEWSLEGDFLTMRIPIDNVGGMPVSIQSISVRENFTGSTEYVDSDPIGLSSGTADITSGGGDTFEWNATSGSAPFDFLLVGKTYIVKVTVFDGFFERTTTAPIEF